MSCLAGAVSRPDRQLEASSYVVCILLRVHVHEFYRYVSGVGVNVVFGRVRARMVAAAACFAFARVCFKYRPNSNRVGLRLRMPLLGIYFYYPPHVLCSLYFWLRVNV